MGFWCYFITESDKGSVGKSCQNSTMCDRRPQMRPKLPKQAVLKAVKGASGRIRFHLMYAAGHLQRNATKTSSNGGLLAKLTPPQKAIAGIACCVAKTQLIELKFVSFDAQQRQP